jgi:hypothetical protein
MEACVVAGRTRDRRRSVRIKRSALLKDHLDDIDRPSIKIAETRDELEQAFSLVYREYQRLGYTKEPNGSMIYLSIYHILPETAVFIFKSYLTVISTLTQIFDSTIFGLPMDSLYQEELDALRNGNRKLAELSALATPRETRWRNLFMHLCRAMFCYAMYENVNDLCIMVNPKHVEFYKRIFLFEDLGPEKYYPNVGAPAVALRLNLDDIDGKLKKKYSSLDFDCDLHSFFCRVTNSQVTVSDGEHSLVERKRGLDTDTVRYFFVEKTNVLDKATPEQMNYIRSLYPGLMHNDTSHCA